MTGVQTCALPICEEGVLGEVYITAYSAHNGKLLWTSNEFKIGMPIWTDGQKLLAVHLDVRHGAIVALKKHRSPIPVWLELWRIGDRKRLWRERIKGIPPPITSYRQVDSRHVLIQFRRNGAVSWNGLFPLMGSTDIIAPIHPSRIKYGESVEIE